MKHKPAHEVRTILDRLTTTNKVVKIIGDFTPRTAYIRLCAVAKANNNMVYSLCGRDGKAQRYNTEAMQRILEAIDQDVTSIYVMSLDKFNTEIKEHAIQSEMKRNFNNLKG